jgi:putative ABC transport system permease protein
MAFTVEGQTHPADEPPNAVFRAATPGYVRSLGIPLLRGRDFSEDDRAETSAVVLVNESLARRYWPEVDPVGRRIRQGGATSKEPWRTIVGVVGDTRQSSLIEPVAPEIVFPYAQNPVAWYRATTLVIGSHAEPSSLAERVKAEAWAIDPDLPITHVLSMSQVLSEAVGQERYNALLLGLFALTALLLAAGGIYGVMAYTVSLRTQEIGVRMALGASARSVFEIVVARGLALSGAGSAAGLLAALGLSRALSGMVHGVSLSDPMTFAGVAIGLLFASFLACALPALRAARVDPLTALRRD